MLKQTFIIAACAAGSLSALYAQPSAGGSNFNWYGNAPGDTTASGVYFYDVIANYNDPGAQSAINTALQGMYNQGQRRLRLMIFTTSTATQFPNGGAPTQCTDPIATRWDLMDNTSGNLSSQCLANLQNLLATIRAMGFQEVVVAYGPQGANDAYSSWPDNWYFTQPYETYYQQNWNLIVNLRPILAAAGLNIKVDLKNEGVPHDTAHQAELNYCARLWSDYTSMFGKVDTMGFSIAGPGQRRHPRCLPGKVDFVCYWERRNSDG